MKTRMRGEENKKAVESRRTQEESGGAEEDRQRKEIAQLNCKKGKCVDKTFGYIWITNRRGEQ